MTSTDNIQDNEIIEAFWVSQGGKPNLKEDLCFYKNDWGMLMPVVEKIENVTGSRIKIQGVECEISIVDYYDLQIERSKIRAVYKAVVEFIKWRNEVLEKH